MAHRTNFGIPGVGHRAPIPMAAVVDRLFFTSAISGKDPRTGEIPSDPAEQAKLAFRHLKELLAQAGATVDGVAKMSVLVVDDSIRKYVDREWIAMFPEENSRPARHTTVTALRGGAALQIEATAVVETTLG